jgi:hypothetical protein
VSALNHALRLASKGIPVFPCKNTPDNKETDKTPHVSSGFYAATTDEAQIKDWWSHWPQALIGAPTGERLVVVDVDLQHTPAGEWWERYKCELPDTRAHVTRSGGLHLLFKPESRMKCSTGKISKNIDTRGAGGYIIWWPAFGLRVINPKILADIPSWVVQLFVIPEPTPVVHTVAFRGAPCDAPSRLKGILDTAAKAAEDLIHAGMATGLPAHEARRTVASAMRRP